MATRRLRSPLGMTTSECLSLPRTSGVLRRAGRTKSLHSDSHESAEDASSSSDGEESDEENAGSLSSGRTRKRQRSPEQDEELERNHRVLSLPDCTVSSR